MTLLLDFGFDKNGTTGVVQQLSAIGCVYQRQATILGVYLEPEGEIIDGADRDQDGLPGWVLMKSGEGRYFLAIEGTMQYTQFAMQGGPTNIAASYNDGKAHVGYAWLGLAMALKKLMWKKVPWTVAGTKFYVSGHSMGGAMALILACEASKEIGPANVQCVTFGQPATFTEESKLPGVSTYVRYRSVSDPVPTYPYQQNGWVLEILATPSSWVPGLLTWKQFGPDAPINWDGVIQPEEGPIGKPGPGVQIGYLYEHGMANYGGRLAAKVKRQGSDPVAVEALESLFTILEQADPPDVRVPGPNQLGLPDNIAAAIAARVGGLVLTGQGSGGKGMGIVQHSWVFFDLKGANWTENYFISADSARASMNGLTVPMIQDRMAFLYTGHTLRMIRARELGGSRSSWSQIYNLAGTFNIKDLASSPDVTSTSVVYALKGKSGGQRKIWFRGMADEAVSRDALNGNDKLAAVTQTAIGNWLKTASMFGYAIKYRAKPGQVANTDYRVCTGVDGTAGNGTALVTVADSTGYLAGSTVNLSLFDEKILPGINGAYQLLKVVGTTLQIHYRTPGNANFATAGGRCRLIVTQDLSTIDPVASTFDHLGDRQTKSDFTRSRGSRRAKRLRNAV